MKMSDLKEQAKTYASEHKAAKLDIDDLEKAIYSINRQKSLAEEIEANNLMLKGSIKNLFDLVPDKITLSRVYMDKDKLIIQGITPTKDTFNFLLGAPLKSIFHESKTLFYLQDNGWYSFVSSNFIIDDEVMDTKEDE
jgi:hypothetical protein